MMKMGQMMMGKWQMNNKAGRQQVGRTGGVTGCGSTGSPCCVPCEQVCRRGIKLAG